MTKRARRGEKTGEERRRAASTVSAGLTKPNSILIKTFLKPLK